MLLKGRATEACFVLVKFQGIKQLAPGTIAIIKKDDF